MKTHYLKGALLCSTVIAATAMAVPAFAQDTAESAEEGNTILVTGSRIVRRDLETAAPVAVVSSEEFSLSGTVNVENVINTLPQVIPGTTSFSNNPGGGVATLNLRGLGSQRNLVLVNGRRWMFYSTNQVVDLNTIPTFLLDSVDVVTGGASAVYGSDAIAGVTNFRLRHVDGIEAGGQYSLTEQGDGQRYNAWGAIGTSFDDGRGRATLFTEYYNRGSVFQGDRSFSDAVLGDDGAGGFVPGGSSTLPDGVLRYFGDGDTTGTDFDANAAVVFDAPGDFRTRAGDLYNYGPANYLMVPQERYLVGGMAEYDISDGHTAYLEAAFVNNRVANELAATPVTGTFTVDLATVAPFMGAAENAQLAAIDASEPGGADGSLDLFVQRRVVETGSRNSLDERNAFRILAGMRGPIGDNWNYDAYYMYARTRNSNIQAGNISRSAFQRGLDGTDPAINIFGPGTLTTDMVDQISILAQNGNISVLQVASASVSGTLGNFGMGADDLGLAFGAEYRKMGSEFIPDTALASGDVIGFNAGLPTAGGYDVKELFAEVRIPIAAYSPGVYKLELSGAGRYSDYSLGNVGGVWTYAFGAEYAPIPDITFRGQYQRAVRAPNVVELFGGASTGFPGATDPCSLASAATDATINALCVATGVPAAAVGTPGIQLNTQIQANFGGNPNLQEEVSDSWTAGVVFRPEFLPGFSATVDYYNIEVEGAISQLGGGLANTLDLCYNIIQDISSQYCQVFVGARNSGGVFDGATPPAILNANTALLAVEGIDFQVNYATALPFALLGQNESRLSMSFMGTYALANDFTPVQELPDEVNECAGRFGQLACGEPTPKWKWNSRLSWIDGPLTTSLRWRHLSGVEDDDVATPYSTELLGSYDVFDLTFAADLSENLTLSVGVSNLFNKTPELIGDNQEQANTYPSTYDVLGRDFFASARVKF